MRMEMGAVQCSVKWTLKLKGEEKGKGNSHAPQSLLHNPRHRWTITINVNQSQWKKGKERRRERNGKGKNRFLLFLFFPPSSSSPPFNLSSSFNPRYLNHFIFLLLFSIQSFIQSFISFFSLSLSLPSSLSLLPSPSLLPSHVYSPSSHLS